MINIFSINNSFENVEIALNLLNYSNDILIFYESKFQPILYKALKNKNLKPIDDRPGNILLSTKQNILNRNIM